MTGNGALPAYLQIAELITREIGAGRLSDGEKLPPERRMAAEHGVAVRTLRKALAELEARDLLDRRHGSGNYVRASHAAKGIYAMFRLELPAGGGLPTARVLDVASMTKPADIPEIGNGVASGLRIRRLRLLNKLPVAVEEIWLDGRYTVHLKPEDLLDSLYLTYRKKANLWILRADDRVGLGALPDWAPDEIGLPPGATTGLVERRAFDRHGAPCEFSRTWFNPDRARYVARIT